MARHEGGRRAAGGLEGLRRLHINPQQPVEQAEILEQRLDTDFAFLRIPELGRNARRRGIARQDGIRRGLVDGLRFGGDIAARQAGGGLLVDGQKILRHGLLFGP